MHVQACQEIYYTSDQYAQDILFGALFSNILHIFRVSAVTKWPHKYPRILTKWEVQRSKPVNGGKLCCISRVCLIEDHLATHFLGNPQRMAAAKLEKKKSAPWRRQRIIFKKEHNLTFLSTTHSTPPPHSLVFPPACSSISLFFPSLSPGCSCTILLTCVSFSVSQAGTPARTPH